ncbi:MAG: hypothetical protein ACJ8CR_01875 [Roseiflexaceae bacterium]
MAAQCREADDLDLVLRDALREATAARADSTRVWSRLRARIVSARPSPRHPRAPVRTLGFIPSPEWTLDRHLMSLARVVR